MKVVALWSGGKDSCFACYEAKNCGYEVIALFNFLQFNGKNSLSHGLSSEIILRQTELTGIPLMQKKMPTENYRQAFKDLITAWKQDKQIEGMVFGDIYLQEHKAWIDQVCRELEIKAVLPLWGRESKELVREIIKAGFKTIVVSTRAGLLGQEWLGREIDKEFVKGLSPDIDPCGEKGEFHTFVYDGPIFRRPLNFSLGKKTLKDGTWFLEINPKPK